MDFSKKKVRNKNFTILLIENCQQYQEETKQNITHGKNSKKSGSKNSKNYSRKTIENIRNQNFNISLMDFFLK